MEIAPVTHYAVSNDTRPGKRWVAVPIDLVSPAGVRAHIDQGYVTKLATMMLGGAQFMPVTASRSGQGWRVQNGHHRLAASKLAGFTELPTIQV